MGEAARGRAYLGRATYEMGGSSAAAGQSLPVTGSVLPVNSGEAGVTLVDHADSFENLPPSCGSSI